MKYLSTFAIVFMGLKTFSQSCCSKQSSAESFALLSRDPDFVSAHPDPLPFLLPAPVGNEIEFKTPDGSQGYAYEVKNSKGSDKYVLVIHEWWGLNDYIRRESEKIFNELGDVNVIALDLYDRKVADNKDSAAKYMRAVKRERAEAIIKGAMDHAGKKASFASIGWCFGGGWSLQCALLGGKQNKACVMYYGMPEENTDKLKKLEAPVLLIWPEQDKWINKEVVNKFEINAKTLKKSLKVEPYNADHAFANPSNPKYNKEMADDAFKKSMQFIKDFLK